MKNSSIREMISNQFPDVNPSDITVEFLYSLGIDEYYKIAFVDEDFNYRKFELSVKFKEISNER